jgi:hypothetical protein
MTLYYGKCGCGWLKTDYPFMSCGICGYIGCGSKEQIEVARNEGWLIEWQRNPPENIPNNTIKNCCIGREY